jgi:hypothetical protein
VQASTTLWQSTAEDPDAYLTYFHCFALVLLFKGKISQLGGFLEWLKILVL